MLSYNLVFDAFSSYPNDSMIPRCFLVTALVFAFTSNVCAQQDTADTIRSLQFQAIETGKASWGHWGDTEKDYTDWATHSNRLVPVYSFGLKLDSVRGKNSIYRSEEKLTELYGFLPEETLNPTATYFDQTDICKLNRAAFNQGLKKNIILLVFDGMDWDTAHAATVYRNRSERSIRGWDTGLAFLDYDKAAESDRGSCVTAPHNSDTKVDVIRQVLKVQGTERLGGYCAKYGGQTAWSMPPSDSYLKGDWKALQHPWTDSAASATSLNTGAKTFNGSINIAPDGSQYVPLAREMQAEGFSVGIVTSVPISHATPACVYANNVTRNDYQDITRDLLGLPSTNHRKPLPGVDVLLGCGWGEMMKDDRAKQGNNYEPGRKYIANSDWKALKAGDKYLVTERTKGRDGTDVINEAADQAIKNNQRLFGFFGVKRGRLPYQTADGNYNPTRGSSEADKYSTADISENPTLAEMTSAALRVLETNERGFYLMVEAGDVDKASHQNNIDNAIGAVFSGDDAFKVIVEWVEKNSNWEETQLIVTADHGHLFFMDDVNAFNGKLKPIPEGEFKVLRAKLQAAKEVERKRVEAAKKAKQEAAAKKAKRKAEQENAARKKAATS